MHSRRVNPLCILQGVPHTPTAFGVKSGEIWKERREFRGFVSRMETGTFPAPSACVSRETKRKFGASFLFRFYFECHAKQPPKSWCFVSPRFSCFNSGPNQSHCLSCRRELTYYRDRRAGVSWCSVCSVFGVVEPAT